jgi:hypothetical protein
MGPLLVTESGFPAHCAAAASNTSGVLGGSCDGSKDLFNVYYAQAVYALVIAAVLCAHFPAMPALPPTTSAAASAEAAMDRSCVHISMLVTLR